MKLSDKIISLIRTAVPAAVGPVLLFLTTWLVNHGIKVDLTGWTIPVAGAVIAAATSVYYSVVRWGEKKFPWLGKLLGVQATPVYVKPATQPPAQTGVAAPETPAPAPVKAVGPDGAPATYNYPPPV